MEQNIVAMNDTWTTTKVVVQDEELGFFQDTMNNLGDAWDAAYLMWSVQWLLIGVPGNLLIISAIAIFKELK